MDIDHVFGERVAASPPDVSVVVTAEPDEGALVLPLSGPIDLSTADEVRARAVVAVNTTGVKSVVLDMTAVTFLDSTGIGALWDIYCAAMRNTRLPLTRSVQNIFLCRCRGAALCR